MRVLTHGRDSCCSAPIVVKMALLERKTHKLGKVHKRSGHTYFIGQNLHLVWWQLE